MLHATATKIYHERFAAGWQVITHSGVMLEVGNGLARVRLRERAARLRERLAASAQAKIVWIDEEIYEAGWQLYAARPDKDWGVIDCISSSLWNGTD